MKRKILFIGVIILILAVCLFGFALVNYLIELRDIKECAQTPGCMYCLPKWVGGTANICYFISLLLCGVSILCFINYNRLKRKN